MELGELKKSLDRIGWGELVDAELRERRPTGAEVADSTAELQTLAAKVDVELLRALEKEDGYLVWTLRLAPLVDAVFASRLAQTYLSHADWRTRHWATVIANAPAPGAPEITPNTPR